MTQQWNASIQHQVGTWMFDVTYAANKGNHFAGSSYDLNQVDPAVRLQLGQSLFTPVPNPYAGLVPGGLGAATITRENSLRAFPYYSSVTVRNPRLGNYMSHQLQFNVTKRMANGLLVNFAFTGGKKLSDSTLVPVDFGPIEQITENGYQDGLYNRQLNKSVDPGDVSKRGVISALYELPFGPGKKWNPSNGFLQRVVGGWQINTIGVMQTGIPLIVRGASNNAANRPSSTGESAKTRQPDARALVQHRRVRKSARVRARKCRKNSSRRPHTRDRQLRSLADQRHPHHRANQHSVPGRVL